MESSMNVLKIGLTGVFKNTLKEENLIRDWKRYVKTMDNSFRMTGDLGLKELKAFKEGMYNVAQEYIVPEELIKVAKLDGFTVEMIQEAKEELLRYIDNNCN